MEWQSVLQAVLSLIFVIGLLLLTLWLIKYCELKSSQCRIFKKLSDSKKLDIIEIRRIDSKNSLALIKYDETEYLLLLGASNNILLKETSRTQE